MMAFSYVVVIATTLAIQWNRVASSAISPLDKGIVHWSQKLEETGNGHSSFSHGEIYVSNSNCDINILDVHGERKGKVDSKVTNASCQTGLLFAYDSNFFITTAINDDETSS